MVFRPGNDTDIWWEKRQSTYSGDDSGVKLDISSGVGTAHARTAKEREGEKKFDDSVHLPFSACTPTKQFCHCTRLHLPADSVD